jgi:hypothetical protein
MVDIQRRVDGESFIDRNNNVKFIHFDADMTSYQLKPHETIVHATSENADASAILTLPSKAEMAGKMVYICATTGATGGDISVYDKEAGSEITTYGDMDADDDHVLFFCDGVNWRVVLDGVA